MTISGLASRESESELDGGTWVYAPFAHTYEYTIYDYSIRIENHNVIDKLCHLPLTFISSFDVLGTPKH